MSKRRPIMAVLVVAAMALVATACGEDEPVATGPSVEITSTSLGQILTDEDGNTLYLFIPDGQGASVCNDACADAWPPLVGSVTAGDGVDSGLLGTAGREDGRDQATYNGWPLYYFGGDVTAGDTNGQGVNDVWFAISASGDAVR